MRQAAKVHMKRCHGRLYSAKKLHAFTVRVLAPLRVALESYIRNSATALLFRQRKTLFPQPSENTAMDISATTLRALLGPEGMMEEPLRLEFSVYSR